MILEGRGTGRQSSSEANIERFDKHNILFDGRVAVIALKAVEASVTAALDVLQVGSRLRDGFFWIVRVLHALASHLFLYDRRLRQLGRGCLVKVERSGRAAQTGLYKRATEKRSW